jgi:hypothetical protein
MGWRDGRAAEGAGLLNRDARHKLLPKKFLKTPINQQKQVFHWGILRWKVAQQLAQLLCP